MTSIPDRAERMVRHRAILAIVLATLLIATQGQRMGSEGSLIGWAIWGAIVAGFLLWASGLFQGRRFRGLIDDETSTLHRRRALTIGFWVMVASAGVCFGLTFVKDFGPRDAIQLILTCGISAALLSFGVWERAAIGR